MVCVKLYVVLQDSKDFLIGARADLKHTMVWRTKVHFKFFIQVYTWPQLHIRMLDGSSAHWLVKHTLVLLLGIDQNDLIGWDAVDRV